MGASCRLRNNSETGTALLGETLWTGQALDGLWHTPGNWQGGLLPGELDFARILTVFMAIRAWAVLRVALRPETASVAAPWGGEITFRAGAAVFFIVTVVAALFVAVAAWSPDQKAHQ